MHLSPVMFSAASLPHASRFGLSSANSRMSAGPAHDQVQFSGLNKLKGKLAEKVSGIQQITSIGDDSPGTKHFENGLNYAISANDLEQLGTSKVFDGQISLLEPSQKPDAGKAEAELKKAANRGKNLAVAQVYAEGFGLIKPDAAKTRTYLERGGYQQPWDAMKAAIHLAQGWGPMPADPKASRHFLDTICAKEPDLMPFVIRVYEQGLGDVKPDPDKVRSVRQSLINAYENRATNPKAYSLTEPEILEIIRSYAQSESTVQNATALLDEIIEKGTSKTNVGSLYSGTFASSYFSELSHSPHPAKLIIEAIKLVAGGSGVIQPDAQRADQLTQKLYTSCRDWDVILQLADLLRTGHGAMQPHPKAAFQLVDEYVQASKAEDWEPKEALAFATNIYKLSPELAEFYTSRTNGSNPVQ